MVCRQVGKVALGISSLDAGALVRHAGVDCGNLLVTLLRVPVVKVLLEIRNVHIQAAHLFEQGLQLVLQEALRLRRGAACKQRLLHVRVKALVDLADLILDGVNSPLHVDLLVLDGVNERIQVCGFGHRPVDQRLAAKDVLASDGCIGRRLTQHVLCDEHAIGFGKAVQRTQQWRRRWHAKDGLELLTQLLEPALHALQNAAAHGIKATLHDVGAIDGPELRWVDVLVELVRNLALLDQFDRFVKVVLAAVLVIVVLE